jgi:hypothetical protein
MLEPSWSKYLQPLAEQIAGEAHTSPSCYGSLFVHKKKNGPTVSFPAGFLPNPFDPIRQRPAYPTYTAKWVSLVPESLTSWPPSLDRRRPSFLSSSIGRCQPTSHPPPPHDPSRVSGTTLDLLLLKRPTGSYADHPALSWPFVVLPP